MGGGRSPLAGGASPEVVVVDGVAGAIRVVGDRWAAGRLSVDDEHRASGVANRLVSRLGPLAARRGPKRGAVVLGCPPGERHGLPTALAANVLRGRGYQVVDLGADVPADAFAAAVTKTEQPIAAAVGVTAGEPRPDGAGHRACRPCHLARGGGPVGR